MSTRDDTAWMDDAACSGLPVEWFFIEIGCSAKKARSVCATCPVKAECLQYGVNETEGIWGGTSDEQRRVLRRTGVIGEIWKKEPAPCGTYAAYTRGCRCDPCKEVKRIYSAKYRANTKRCPMCKKTRSSNGFYPDRSRKDGLQSACKDCRRQRTLLRQAECA